MRSEETFWLFCNNKMVVNQVILFINDVIYLHACECQTLQRHFYFICYSPSDCCDDDDAKYCYFL